MTFSVDGHAYETRTPADTHGIKWVFDHPIYLIMNLAVGGYWLGDANGNTQFRSP
ncbi:family 16 glycosylhydrolase [Streptomyces sp. RPT161]|uniref:family 16 glycosylhydrolase n=1 Tax=Streptomyces sp. RPT161 TaxID=3015993 RepID=UPI0022B8D78C|nr:family 16 glycosylhydrolase [Streptomyces sp. RPT161]